jgi:hypothetical protein
MVTALELLLHQHGQPIEALRMSVKPAASQTRAPGGGVIIIPPAPRSRSRSEA